MVTGQAFFSRRIRPYLKSTLNKLDDYVHEGIELDSKFIPQIMGSIFISQSPVHDGAAIIKKNRIAKVGAFLPLTQKAGLPQQFGTRHRAAIGITEVCDAVAIAVSEEVHRLAPSWIQNRKGWCNT